MTVFVLLGACGYEGDEVLGVYSSQDAAETAQRAHNDVPTNSHAWGISEHELDAPPVMGER